MTYRYSQENMTLMYVSPVILPVTDTLHLRYVIVEHTRKYFFCSRVTNIWNSLPIDIVTAPSLNSFKNRLDKHWLQQDIKYKKPSCR